MDLCLMYRTIKEAHRRAPLSLSPPPFPYRRRSRLSCRIARPLAIVSTPRTEPMISKSIGLS
jgi:hypothetical protein